MYHESLRQLNDLFQAGKLLKVDAEILSVMNDANEVYKAHTLNVLRFPVLVRTEQVGQFDATGMGILLISILNIHAMNINPDELLRLNDNPIVESVELSRAGGSY